MYFESWNSERKLFLASVNRELGQKELMVDSFGRVLVLENFDHPMKNYVKFYGLF